MIRGIFAQLVETEGMLKRRERKHTSDVTLVEAVGTTSKCNSGGEVCQTPVEDFSRVALPFGGSPQGSAATHVGTDEKVLDKRIGELGTNVDP